MKKLPKQLFVTWCHDLDEPYPHAAEDYYAMDDGETVGVYELKEVRKKLVSHSLSAPARKPK